MNRSAISSLRGSACLMLVLYHVVGGTPEQGLRLSEGWLRAVCDLLAAVRMPLFALLAGALHAYSGQSRPGRLPARSSWAVLQDKFLRLILPMLTVGTLFALVQSLTPETNDNTEHWSTLHLLPVAHFWFLEALFLIFVVWTLLSHWALVGRAWAQLALAALALTAYLSAWGTAWLALAGAVYLLPFFGAGFLWVRHRVAVHGYVPALASPGAPHGLMLPGWAGPVLALAAMLSLVMSRLDPSPDRMTAAMLVAGLLSASALWLLPLRHPLLAWVGERSYAIFLFHVFFTAATRLALSWLGWPAIASDGLALALHVLLGVAAGVMGGALVHAALQGRPRLALLFLGQLPKRSGDARKQAAFNSAPDLVGKSS